jgi:D-alanyl-D-alanine endopeptidase (penicillin-binding protein 7)
MTPTPVKAPARSRLGKALAGFLIAGSVLLPAELPLGSLTGAGTADAASTRTTKTSVKASTSRKVATSTSKSSKRKRASTVKSRRKGKAGARRSIRSRRVSRVQRSPRALLLIDAQTGEVLFDKNSGASMPIASLTKLMTMMVYLESEPDLSKRVIVSREDLAGSGKSQLRTGEVLSQRDLLHLALLSSDNAATKSLVRNSGIPAGEYLGRMNRKAQVLGLHSTRFVEFTGLSELNVSSAQDMAQILKAANKQPLIAHITTLPDYSFRTQRRIHQLVNTNRLARYGTFDVKGGKTGFINEAGYCLVTWVSTRSRDVIAVVLGAPSNPARFTETRRLIDRVALAPRVVARGT